MSADDVDRADLVAVEAEDDVREEQHSRREPPRYASNLLEVFADESASVRVCGVGDDGSDVDDWQTGGKTYCGLRVCDPVNDRCAADYGPQDHADNVRYEAITAYAARVHPRVTIVSLGSNLLTSCPASGVLLVGSDLEALSVWYDNLDLRSREILPIRPDRYATQPFLPPARAPIRLS